MYKQLLGRLFENSSADLHPGCAHSGKLDLKLNWRIPLDESNPEGKFVERSDTQNFVQVGAS